MDRKQCGLVLYCYYFLWQPLHSRVYGMLPGTQSLSYISSSLWTKIILLSINFSPKVFCDRDLAALKQLISLFHLKFVFRLILRLSINLVFDQVSGLYGLTKLENKRSSQALFLGVWMPCCKPSKSQPNLCPASSSGRYGGQVFGEGPHPVLALSFSVSHSYLLSWSLREHSEAGAGGAGHTSPPFSPFRPMSSWICAHSEMLWNGLLQQCEGEVWNLQRRSSEGGRRDLAGTTESCSSHSAQL